MTTSFNMFVDMELVELASLITRASWAEGNIDESDFSKRSFRLVPSVLAKKTKPVKKTSKKRSVS